MHQTHRNIVGMSRAPIFEISTRSPRVERALGGAAMYLKINLMVQITRQGPIGGILEIPPEYQGHAVLWHPGRAVNFIRAIALRNIVEHGIQITFEIPVLNLAPGCDIHGVNTVELAIQSDQIVGARWKKHTLFKHLHL